MKKLSYIVASVALLLVVARTTSAGNHESRVPINVPTTGTEAQEEGMERACEAVEESIQTRNDQIVLLAETILTKFDNISERVQEYYTTELVPEGHEVENYDALLADIEDKRADVEAALDEAASSAENFDCDLSDPKTSVLAFKDDMLGVIDALQEYRLAIKDLIVAVNTVVASGEGGL